MPSIPLTVLANSKSINIGTFHAYSSENYKYKLTKWYLAKFMNKLDSKSVIGISALLVHAAKIDEIYSNHEKDLIKNFITFDTVLSQK